MRKVARDKLRIQIGIYEEKILFREFDDLAGISFREYSKTLLCGMATVVGPTVSMRRSCCALIEQR